MADGVDELPPLFQRWLIEPDYAAFKRSQEGIQERMKGYVRWTNDLLASAGREQASTTRKAQKKITDETKKGADQQANATKSGLDRQAALFKAHLDQHVRLQKAAAEQEERRDKQRLERLAARQAAAAKQRLQDTKQAEDRDRDVRRQADRIAALDHDHALKNERERQRKADWIETHELEQKFKRRTAEHASYLRMREQRQAAADRVNLAQVTAHQDRITARHKAMWSVVRTLTESGSRFMSSITQSGLRSMGSAVGIGLSRITGAYKREGAQQEAALRSSFADQEQITRRALVRQQGIVQGFQQRNAAITQGGAGGGPIGAIMSVRNMLLGAGAFISARAIFGPVIDYQQTQIAFEGILQSTTAAEAMLAELQEFAKVTPFTFTGIADSAKQLLAVGYAAEDVIPMMTTLGNTAAGLGLGEDAISGVIRALGQMKGKGKASAEELQQISEQLPGFSAIEAIASSMGITVSEAFDQMKAGAIPADAAITAILEGMERMPGAAGAMERQSKTLAGRLSTLKDTIEILLIRAMDPFIESISNAVGMFTTFLDNLFNAGGVFAVARSAILGLAIAFGSMLAYQGVVLMLDGIKLALVGIAQHPAILMFTGLVTTMVLLYRHVPRVTQVVDDMRKAFGEFLSGARESLGLLMDGDLPGFVDRVSELGSDLRDALAPSVGVISDFLVESFDTASDWVRDGGMGDLWDTITETISTTAQQIADSPAAEWLVEFGKESWQRWQDWLDGGGLGDLADSIKWRILDAVIKVRDGIKNIDWERFMTPAILGIGAAIVALFVLNLPLWLVAGIAIALSSPRVRQGFEEKVMPKLVEMFEGQNWTPVITTLVVGLVAAVALAFTAPGFVVPVLVATAIVAAIAAAIGNPQARKAFKKMGSWLSDKFGEAFSDIDWVEVYGTVLAGIEKVTAKITKWLTLFLTSKEFVTIAAGILLALAGIAGAVIVGFFEGLFKALSQRNDEVYDAITEWLGGLFKDFHPFDKDGALRGVIPDVTWGDVFGPIIDGLKSAWKGLVDGLDPSNWLPKGPRFAAAGNAIWDIMKPGFGYLFEQLNALSFGMLAIGAGMADGFVGAFTSLGERVLKAIMKGLGSASSFAQDFVNAIIRGINTGLIDKLNDINIGFDPPVGPSFSWTPGLPHIPEVALAKGGIVTKPTVALIGEAGPEAVVPLSDGMGKIPLSVMFDTSAIAGQVAGVAALLAPMGERISEATMPGLRSWADDVRALLDKMRTDFEGWGRAMVTTATLIGTSIASAMTSALREGRGEVVRIVRGYGRSLASALNPLLEAIGEQPVTMEFAKGGIVESREGAQVHVFNEGRRGRGSSHGEAYIPFDPANKPRSQALATETVRRLGGDVQWYARGGLSPEAIRRGQAFARAQDGKPYVWGGVGPNGYDCSGLASAIVNAVRGEDPYRRLFTSGSLVAGASAGLLPGLGQVSVGARSGSPGHVSTTIAGLNAESTGDHVRIGAAARSAADFPSRWHLGSGVYIGPNGTVYPLPEIPEVGRGELGRLGSGWMRYVKDRAQRFVDENTYTGTAFGGPESGVPSGMMVGDGSPEVFAAIRRAMGIVGVPSSWLGPLLTLIGRESSFNPRAYDRTLGASGLMQTIPSTFAAYHLDPWNNIFGPTDNVIAGLRYIIGRYGSIFNVGQAMSPTPTRGYSYGGVVDREGLYRLAEGNRREMVLPLENPSRTSALLRRLGVDTGPTDEMVRPARANVEMGSVIGVMNVNTNAADPETVATITTNKIDQRVRQIMAGV